MRPASNSRLARAPEFGCDTRLADRQVTANGAQKAGGRQDDRYECSRLGNGVQVLSERMDGVGSVAVGAWLRHGSALDPSGLTGSSHLLEHMVFRGTGNRSRRQIAAALEGLGGSLNAYTAREHTGYEARVLDRHLGAAVEVLSDLVLNPLLRDEDLKREKEVVFEEIAAVEDTPDDLVFERHGNRMWCGHPYGSPILGTRQTVAAITRADLVELHRHTYVGANLVVAAAGRVDHDSFSAMTEEWFGGLEQGTAAAPVVAPRDARLGMDDVHRDSAQTHIVVGSPVPGASHPDRYVLLLVSAALGGGMSSRLFQRVREELALAYSIYTFQTLYTHAGLFGVYLGTRPAWTAAALTAVDEVSAAVARDGLRGDELDRTKEQVKGEIVLSLESPAARVGRLAGFALRNEPWIPMEVLPDLIDGVTKCDIVRVASEALGPGRRYVLTLGPRNPARSAGDPHDPDGARTVRL